ncbi:MAG: GNAT family N-acetyltransferase [Christensenella sp.]|nr:GNAT family N-acetyltransferase [Christensenella sp.]
MAYDIRPLSPDLAETFSNYLTNLDFSNTPHWASCFCRYYQTTCSFEEWRNRSLETNRSEALQEIKTGNMRGYLAFDGETCVGWCNANDIVNFPRIYPDVEPFCRGKHVGCTICFLIHPLHRGKGLAREMLARAIADFRAAGFDAMLALPVETADAGQRRYRGTLHMYQQAGYRECKVEDNLHIMWLELK